MPVLQNGSLLRTEFLTIIPGRLGSYLFECILQNRISSVLKPDFKLPFIGIIRIINKGKDSDYGLLKPK